MGRFCYNGRMNTRKNLVGFVFSGLVCCALAVSAAETRRLSLADYRDRMEGAWIGQMVGVAWGTPTEFRFNSVIIPADKVPKWASDFPLRMAYNNDDLYVEMTFLRTLEQHGLDASPRQAGIDFANSEYQLWCANLAGRNNLRMGIAPPDCSHPKYNNRANDIDYQIEADYAGIISPGCPQEVVRLGGVFGRLMNYGDGVWAGEFIGALYAEAFFTDDVNRLLDAGLKAIPAESDYARMVRNVRAWHKEFPDDWTKAWEKVHATYEKAKNPALRDSNGGIDVRLNGACIILGLLYGNGDLDLSMEISMRCGWDSDCNPSNVGGILMCARGARALPAKYTEKLDLDKPFTYTAYTPRKLYAVCEKLARQVVARAGGSVEKDACGKEWFAIPVKDPVPEPFTPTWNPGPVADSVFTAEEMKQQKFACKLPDPRGLRDPDPTVRVQKALDGLWPGWKTSKNAPDMNPGFRGSVESTTGVALPACVLTHPPKRDEPVILSRTVKVPAGNPVLRLQVGNAPHGDSKLVVRVDGQEILVTDLRSPSRGSAVDMRSYVLSLAPWTGREVKIELLNQPTGWFCEAAVWKEISLSAASGTF